MKLRYLTLSGLLIITLGCLLPFEIQEGSVHRLFPSWFIPILGIIFLLMSKEGTFGNGRVLGGLFGLLMGTITALFLLHRDTTFLGQIIYQGPVTILIGSLLACIGGFLGYKRTSSLNFHLATILALMAIGLMFITVILCILPQTSLLMFSLGNIFVWFLNFYLVMIFVSSIIILRESRRTIQ